MKCGKIEKLLVLFIDGILKGKKREKVEKHLQVCDSCRAKLEEFKTIMDYLGKLGKEKMPEDLYEKIYKRVENEKQALNYDYFYRPAFGIIIMLFVIGGCLILNKYGLEIRRANDGSLKVAIPSFSKTKETKKYVEKTIVIARYPRDGIVFRGGQAVESVKIDEIWTIPAENPENKSRIINSQEEWREFWKRQMKGKIPEMDFRNKSVLIIYSKAPDLKISEVKASPFKYYISATVSEETSAAGRLSVIVVNK